MNEAHQQEWTDDSITAAEQKVLNDLRDRGFCVVIWTPTEIGDSDIGSLEDIVIERGNIFLGRDEEDEEGEANA